MDAHTLDDSRALSVNASLVVTIIVITILGAFAFQASGYAPCELCLKERWPYYAGLAIGSGTFILAWYGAWAAARIGFMILLALFLFSAAFGIYHAGVEWRFWPGPSDCTGTLDHAKSNADFLHQLETVKVVRCDAVAIRILGLSLAGWNAVVSLIIVIFAAAALRRRRMIVS